MAGAPILLATATAFYRMLDTALPAGLLHRVAVLESANDRFGFGGHREAAPQERP